ncbi:MAG: AMP-binding protein [Pleurocapsa sp. MO_192.B19]|nr:AMP-binding protein [Pleurocapsa sp. MO_192.B19]
MLQKTVVEFPEKTALVYGQSRINYQEFAQQVRGFSQGLEFLGVKQSDCVAIILPNCPEFAVSFYAIASLNAIALLLNPGYKENELEHFLRDSNAKVIITDSIRAEACQQTISRLEHHVDLIVVGQKAGNSLAFVDLIHQDLENWQPQDVYTGDVLYQYSSGSTGRPKRVCRTQKNLWHQAHNCVETLQVKSSDNILCLVPLYHAYGFGECLLAAIYSGATLTILEPFSQNGVPVEMPFVFRRARVLELIEQETITILPAVPYIFSILAAAPPEPYAELPSLRLCISAGNFLSQDIFEKFRQRFGIPLRQLYGCTEAGSVAINLESDQEIKYESIGLPMHNVEIKVIGDRGQELPPELEGELVIKSQTLTSGYHNSPEVNKEVFQNGHFFTGDLGKKDEQGYLSITGRKRIFIETGGHKVDPFEVEDVLVTHPNVEEAVVVGTKQPYTGEIVKAVVVCQQQCPEEELIAYCQEKLADFKIPRIIEFRSQIPRSALGKILRKDLV